jgi:hypothetical protein
MKEALQRALDALGPTPPECCGCQVEWQIAITAIKAALEAKDEPVKLRRGDILRCIETDELCTVWATSTSGKTLVKWGSNDFTDYTAEQIGELFWLEPAQREQDGECKNCTDGCPACDARKLPEQEPVTWRNAAIRVGEDLCSVGPFRYYDMTAEQWLDWALSVVTVHAPAPQRTWVTLTEDEIVLISADCAATHQHTDIHFAKAIEAKLKEKNT